MPTKKKRVGFIPREDVMLIIDKLSIENNLSNSKIISILVEEALSIRGMFNKKTGKESKSSIEIKDSPEFSSGKPAVYKDNDKLKINTKLKSYNTSRNTTFLENKNLDAFDLQTYRKFLSFLKFQEMMDEYNT